MNSKINNIYIISQFFTNEIVKYIEKKYFSKKSCFKFLFPSNGDMYQGTVDAIKKNLFHFDALDAEYFLILAADQVFDMDFEKMIAFSKKVNADCNIATCFVKKKEAKRLGLIQVDKFFKIINFYEKPETKKLLELFKCDNLDKENINPPRFLASKGIYLFKKEALLSTVIQEDYIDFGKHLIPDQISKMHMSVFFQDGYWKDVGTLSSYYLAQLDFMKNSEFRKNFENLMTFFSKGDV